MPQDLMKDQQQNFSQKIGTKQKHNELTKSNSLVIINESRLEGSRIEDKSQDEGF